MKLQKKRLNWLKDVCLAKLTEVKAQRSARRASQGEVAIG